MHFYPYAHTHIRAMWQKWCMFRLNKMAKRSNNNNTKNLAIIAKRRKGKMEAKRYTNERRQIAFGQKGFSKCDKQCVFFSSPPFISYDFLKNSISTPRLILGTGVHRFLVAVLWAERALSLFVIIRTRATLFFAIAHPILPVGSITMPFGVVIVVAVVCLECHKFACEAHTTRIDVRHPDIGMGQPWNVVLLLCSSLQIIRSVRAFLPFARAVFSGFFLIVAQVLPHTYSQTRIINEFLNVCTYFVRMVPSRGKFCNHNELGAQEQKTHKVHVHQGIHHIWNRKYS